MRESLASDTTGGSGASNLILDPTYVRPMSAMYLRHDHGMNQEEFNCHWKNFLFAKLSSQV